MIVHKIILLLAICLFFCDITGCDFPAQKIKEENIGKIKYADIVNQSTALSAGMHSVITTSRCSVTIAETPVITIGAKAKLFTWQHTGFASYHTITWDGAANEYIVITQ